MPSLSSRCESPVPEPATAQAPPSLAGAADAEIHSRLLLLPWRLGVRTSGEIVGELKATIELSRFSHWVPVRGIELAGRLHADLKIGGRLLQPVFSGTLSIENGTLAYLPTATILERITAEAVLENNTLQINSFSATDGGRGRINIRGNLALLGAQREIDLVITAANARIIRHDLMDAVIDGSIRLSGPLASFTAAGELEIDAAEFVIPEKMPARVPVVEVRKINSLDRQDMDLIDDELHGPVQAKKDPVLDLRILFPNRLHLRGRGLNTEWAGALTIKGALGSPELAGVLTSVRGDFSFVGHRFTLEASRITFAGEIPPRPRLDLSFVTQTKKYMVTVTAEGPVTEPVVRLTADPALPQDEIVAQLLFGQSIENLSPLQGFRLVATMRKLAGKESPVDVTGRIREILRVDEIGIQNEGEGEAIAIGKYIRDNIYVDVVKRITKPGGSASVEVELTPRISIETRFGFGSSHETGINWTFDY